MISKDVLAEFVRIYSADDVGELINTRPGETKFGEKISFLEKPEDLPDHPAKYVLLGIPEDIGVRANYGNPGTAKAWERALRSLLNIQYTTYNRAEDVLLLGEINCQRQMEQADEISASETHSKEELGSLVMQIDHKVTAVIRSIVSSGKIPIVIGGGHNNSYGNIRGTSEGLNQKINCINFDAHTDFRPLEHRHSGNGFSYACEDGFLDKYFIFGLHRNYTSSSIFEDLEKNRNRLNYSFFEDISIERRLSFLEALEKAEAFCAEKAFGLELDLDAIENMGSSAMTPSGFTMTEARKFISYFSKKKTLAYVHLCEGSPDVEIFPNQVGKALAYLITDVLSGM